MRVMGWGDDGMGERWAWGRDLGLGGGMRGNSATCTLQRAMSSYAAGFLSAEYHFGMNVKAAVSPRQRCLPAVTMNGLIADFARRYACTDNFPV